MQKAHTYSSELLVAVTLLTRPDLWHPIPGPQAHHSPGEQCMQAKSRMQPNLSQYMAILGQGGSWEDAGKVRVGREGGGFSAHDYVSQALWMPPRAQGCHKEEHTHHRTPTSAQAVAEANWGRARFEALGSNLSSHSGQEECVFICCVQTALTSASGNTQSSLGGERCQKPTRGKMENMRKSPITQA